MFKTCARNSSKVREKPQSLILIPKIVLLILLITLLIIILYWYHEGEWRELFFRFKYFFSFQRLRQFILSFGAYSWIVFVVIQALQVAFAPFPGEVTGFVGGCLYGIALGTVLSTVGLVFGAFLAFELTRLFGPPLVKRVVKQEAMERFDHFVTNRGLTIAFVMFLIPGFPKDSLCYLLGLTHLRRLDFLLMNLFGRLPGTLILTMEGVAIGTGKYQAFFILFAGSVAGAVILFFLRDQIVRLFGSTVARIFRKHR